MRLWTPALALALLAVTANLAACSSSTPSGNAAVGPGHGTITGTLHQAGGPAPGTDKPAAGEVYAFRTASLTGTPIAKAKTGGDGSFSLTLPSGTYFLAATSPSYSIDPLPATPPCRGDSPAVVSRGNTDWIDVVCQMK